VAVVPARTRPHVARLIVVWSVVNVTLRRTGAVIVLTDDATHLSADLTRRRTLQRAYTQRRRVHSVGPHYVLPVLWMTTCFHVVTRVGQLEYGVCSERDLLGAVLGAKYDVYSYPV